MARILVVDGFEAIRYLFRDFLSEDYGHDIVLASTSGEAISILKEDKAIDLVILGGFILRDERRHTLYSERGSFVAAFIRESLWRGQQGVNRPLFVTACLDACEIEGAAGVFSKAELVKNLCSFDDDNWINGVLRKNGIEVPPPRKRLPLPDRRPSP